MTFIRWKRCTRQVWDFRIRACSSLCWASVISSICRCHSWVPDLFHFFFTHICVHYCVFISLFIPLNLFPSTAILLPLYLLTKRNWNVGPAVQSAGVEDISKDVVTKFSSGTRIIDVEVDCLSWVGRLPNKIRLNWITWKVDCSVRCFGMRLLLYCLPPYRSSL